jgi:hypothetical protein
VKNSLAALRSCTGRFTKIMRPGWPSAVIGC